MHTLCRYSSFILIFLLTSNLVDNEMIFETIQSIFLEITLTCSSSIDQAREMYHIPLGYGASRGRSNFKIMNVYNTQKTRKSANTYFSNRD